MNKYYKPLQTELEVGLPIEFLAEGAWHKHNIENPQDWSKYLENDDIRVKYLNSEDFEELGFMILLIKSHEAEEIVDFREDGSEITEKKVYFRDNILKIMKDGQEVGLFHPTPKTDKEVYNLVYLGNKHLAKNLLELRKILKL